MRKRRTQVERSAATRETILNATIVSLAEDGYAATSTASILKRAKLSRGALTHQFPSKIELLIAAVHHLSEIRHKEILEAMNAVPDTSDRIDWGLRLTWRAFGGPMFAAVLELWNAARTDRILYETLYDAERQIGRRHREVFAELLGPEYSNRTGFRRAVTSCFIYFRGAALTNFLSKTKLEEDHVVDQCRRLIDWVSEDEDVKNKNVSRNARPAKGHRVDSGELR